MTKISKTNASVIAAICIAAMTPAAFAEFPDLEKVAGAAAIAAQSPLERSWSLGGAAFENGSPPPASVAVPAGKKSELNRAWQNLQGQSRAPRSSLITKPNKSVGGEAAPGGRWGLFKMGFNAGFTAFMIPPAAAAQIPYVGKAASYLVGVPCLVLGAVAGVFMGAYRALLGEGS